MRKFNPNDYILTNEQLVIWLNYISPIINELQSAIIRVDKVIDNICEVEGIINE